jgi:MATE family multidrug resistance protein
MIIATVLVFIPVFLITHNCMENHGLWLALLLFLVARGAGQTFMARKSIFKLKQRSA